MLVLIFKQLIFSPIVDFTGRLFLWKIRELCVEVGLSLTGLGGTKLQKKNNVTGLLHNAEKKRNSPRSFKKFSSVSFFKALRSVSDQCDPQ